MFDWKRYWFPAGAPFPLDEHGFLDAEGDILRADVSLDALHGKRCLVLLGEPGVGKTSAIESEILRINSELKQGRAERIDLRGCRDVAWLTERLEESETIRTWLQSSDHLHLFLDSLDEGNLNDEYIGDTLIRTLKKSGLPVARLSLRIVCRTFEWPSDVQVELRSWVQQQWLGEVEEYELAPLRQRDVRTAVAQCRKDPERFLCDVLRSGVAALAARPVTLKMLLDEFGPDGFPPGLTQIKLFERACLKLCEEPDPRRKSISFHHRNPRYPWPHREQVFAMAARVAVLSRLSGRTSIFYGQDGDTSIDAALVDMAGGFEEAPRLGRFEVSFTSLMQALRCALFRLGDRERLVWAHQTYADFLAAWYLHSNDLTLQRICTLVAVPQRNGWVLVPQLRAITIWLAAMNPAVFAWLLDLDLAALLQSDLLAIAPEQRQQLSECLLQAVEQGKLHQPDHLERFLFKLDNPQLAGTLRQKIGDKDLGPTVRQLAIRMAMETRHHDLADLLTDVATDNQDAYPVRVEAARAVWLLGDEQHKRRMEPLARGEAGPDEEQNLKAYGVRCLWPGIWTVNDLIRHLTAPANGRSEYEWVINHEILPHIPPDQLPCALLALLDRGWTLEWVEDFPRTVAVHTFRRWQEPSVASALAEIFLALAGLGQLPMLIQDTVPELLAHAERRRSILGQLLTHERCSEAMASNIGATGWLPWDEDLNWLKGQEASAPEHLRPLWRSCRKAAKTRVEWKQRFRERRALLVPEALSPEELHKLLEEALHRVEAGSAAWWIRVCYVTGQLLDDQRDDWRWEVNDDPAWGRLRTEALRWDYLTQTERERVVRAAQVFLHHYQPGTLWTTAKVPEWAKAGLAAAEVVYDHGNLAELEEACWRSWGPALALAGAKSLRVSSAEILRYVLTVMPEVVATAVPHLLSRGNMGWYHELRWSSPDSADQLVMQALRDGVVDVEDRETAVSALADYGGGEWLDWLKAEASSGPIRSDQHNWPVLAACLVLKYGGDAGWSFVKELSADNPEAGRRVWAWLAQFGQDFSERMSEGVILEYYIRGCEWFPAEDDRVSPKGTHITKCREKLLQELARRGTSAACDALQRLVEQASGQAEKLGEVLAEAQNVHYSRSWSGPTIPDVRKLVETDRAKCVETEEQLMEAVLAALDRIAESRFEAELWDHKLASPLSEAALSNMLKFRLEQELEPYKVIVGREVEISPTIGRGTNRRPGERVDLEISTWVTGRRGERNRLLQLIVEVKGCWNDRVEADLREQLVDRYMDTLSSRCAIYLVGWFVCEVWQHDESRGRAPWSTIEEARRGLAELSANVSGASQWVQAVVLDCTIKGHPR